MWISNEAVMELDDLRRVSGGHRMHNHTAETAPDGGFADGGVRICDSTAGILARA